MRPHRWLGWALALAGAAALATPGCGSDDPSETTSTTTTGGGGAGGAPCVGLLVKICDGQCVLVADPSYGCGPTSCTPCNLPLGADPKCEDGACLVDSCELHLADCNGDPADGCETQIALDPLNCGDCRNACPDKPHAEPDCAGAKCTYACDPGFDECDGAPFNGCEAELAADPANCSACGAACAPGQGCQASECVDLCPPGLGDCDGDPDNGCEAMLATDPLHCSACDVSCGSGANGVATCANSTCSLVCDPGFDDCDADMANGCETVLSSDPLHCNACAHSCLGAACSAGACAPVTLATGLTPFLGLAVDATTVFVTSGNSVMRVEKDGTALATVSTSPCAARKLALDATRVYWTTCGDVRRSLKDGLVLQTIWSGAGGPLDLAIGGSSLYVGLYQGAAIRKMNLDGSNDGLFVAPPAPFVQDLAIDATRLYFTTWSGDSVEAAELAGGALSTLGATASEAWGIDADATHLFVAANGGDIVKVAKDGSATTVLATGQGGPTDVAVDATHVYWLNNGSGELVRVAKAGGSPQILATGPVGAAIALDASAVYWVTDDGVRKLAK